MTNPLQQPRPEQADDLLPYSLEVWDRPGGDRVRVVALAGTAGIAYAIYYAGLREYFGETVKLVRDGRVVISSGRSG